MASAPSQRLLVCALVASSATLCLSGAAQPTTTVPPTASSPSLPSGLPLRRDPPQPGEAGGWKSAWLLLGLTGAAGGWWWWRRTGRSRRGPQGLARTGQPTIHRLHSQALTPQSSVHAVRWSGEDFLVGCTAQQVTLLARKQAAPPEGETP